MPNEFPLKFYYFEPLSVNNHNYMLTPIPCDRCGKITYDRLWRWNAVKLKAEIRCLEHDHNYG